METVIDILQVNPPARDLGDICTVDGLLYPCYPVQPGLGEGASPVALVILQLCQGLEEGHAQGVVREFFLGHEDYPVLVEKRFYLSHGSCPPRGCR